MSIMPTELPRFAESFRAFIDHPTDNARMLTSDWMSDEHFFRFVADFAPRLMKAGRLGFIASTVPALAQGDKDRYYGIKDAPIVVWWSKDDGKWAPKHSRQAISAYCTFRKVPLALFDTPRSQGRLGG